MFKVSRLRTTDEPRTSDDLQAPDVWPPPDDRHYHTRAKTDGHPTPYGRPTPGRPDRTTDRRQPEPNLRTSDRHRTSGPSRASGRPVTSGRPTHVHRFMLGRSPCTPSPPSSALGLYILHLVQLSRVSKGLAHISCESFAHPLGYLLLGDSSLHRRRSPNRIQDPF